MVIPGPAPSALVPAPLKPLIFPGPAHFSGTSGSFWPRPTEARSPILATSVYFWPLPAIGKPIHFSFAHPLRTPPLGHTLNSAIVRLRLYRFSERKLLRELLMKTVTVGAVNPVTSILRSGGDARGVCSPVRRLTPAPPRPLRGYQPRPLLPTWPIRALLQEVRQSPLSPQLRKRSRLPR